MHTIWSERIQSAAMLAASRRLRFDDRFRDRYLDAFALDAGHGRMLEVGCGPGALAGALRRWYPGAEITGLDRDSAFVAYAAAHEPGIAFCEGDAAALPFADGSFDVTISHTVAEHIEPSAFFGEQYRVLREGGVCLMLSSRGARINQTAPCIAEVSEFERSFWARASAAEPEPPVPVCAYPMSEAEYPRVMAAHGFRAVSTAYVLVDLTPDNPACPAETARAIIESDRCCALDAVTAQSVCMPAEEIAEMHRRINEKYDRRLALYDRGEAQWDTAVAVLLILRGVK